MSDDGCLVIANLAVSNGIRSLVRSVSFNVRPGELVALVGPSGSGKTTILNALAGSLSRALTATGEIHLAGMQAGPSRRRGEGTRMSLIPQRPLEALNPVLSTARIVAEVARARMPLCTKTELRAALRTVFADVGLPEPTLQRKSNQLSGGQRQRVLLAAALVGNPRAILADEPTAAMDVIARREVFDLFRAIATEHAIPVLIATHDRAAVRNYCDRAVILSGGGVEEIVPAGALEEPYLEQASGGESNPFGYRLAASRVSMSFGRHRVIDKIELDLHGGMATGVAGRSGSGKTTLARILSGLIAPDAGSILLTKPAGTRRVAGPSPAIQFVFQEPHASFDPRLPLAESLAGAARRMGVALGRNDTVRMAINALNKVGIDEETAWRRPGEVSGGECQRAAIARAVLFPPAVLIADEPTSGLDPDWSSCILNLLHGLRREHGFALLLISHDIGLLRAVCGEILVIDDGRIVERGTVRQIIDEPAQPITRDLVAASGVWRERKRTHAQSTSIEDECQPNRGIQ